MRSIYARADGLEGNNYKIVCLGFDETRYEDMMKPVKSPRMLRLLLDFGFDPDTMFQSSKADIKMTLLHLIEEERALRDNSVFNKLVPVLLEYGADIMKKDSNDTIPHDVGLDMIRIITHYPLMG